MQLTVHNNQLTQTCSWRHRAIKGYRGRGPRKNLVMWETMHRNYFYLSRNRWFVSSSYNFEMSTDNDILTLGFSFVSSSKFQFSFVFQTNKLIFKILF